MQTLCSAARRSVIILPVLLAILLVSPPISSAQGVGVGGRLAWVDPDSEADVDSVRFIGGQLRLTSSTWGLEISLDHHSESFELLNQKVTETPIQASVLLLLGRGRVAPFLLGGPGWYRRKVELLNSPGDADVDTTEFGWHAGGGLEVRAARHFAIHGDYRFTFLDFGDDDDDDDDNGSFLGGLLPGHRGSMWTLGATVYF